MKILRLLSLSVLYFKLHLKRYLFLIIALSFGFSVITVLTSLKAGMEQNVYQSAQAHYAGDIIILGQDRDVHQRFRITDLTGVKSLIEESDIDYERLVYRTNIGTGTVFANGFSSKLKYVLGVDWENEEDFFKNVSYQDKLENPFEDKGIMISAPVAEQLGVNVGDLITLEAKTLGGQINTASFKLTAIIQDNSIFSYYKCYVSRQELNRLISDDENHASSVGIYLKSQSHLEYASQQLHSVFEKKENTAGFIRNRNEMAREENQKWKGIRYFIVTLPVFLSEVDQLLTAIELIAYFLYVLMVLIILVSIMVTYRLLLRQREKELGTMQAIAFERWELVLMLIFESLCLFLISILAGFILARIILWGASFISFSWIPGFDIFMKDGKLSGHYSMKQFLINSGIVLAVLLPAVGIPVYNATRLALVDLLSGGNK